jgi:hypothetical protein
MLDYYSRHQTTEVLGVSLYPLIRFMLDDCQKDWYLGGGTSQASRVPFLPLLPGDKCEYRVHAAPVGSIPLRPPRVRELQDFVIGRHPLNLIQNVADVPPNLFGEGTRNDDVVDGFRFLVAEEAQTGASDDDGLQMAE